MIGVFQSHGHARAVELLACAVDRQSHVRRGVKDHDFVAVLQHGEVADDAAGTGESFLQLIEGDGLLRRIGGALKIAETHLVFVGVKPQIGTAGHDIHGAIRIQGDGVGVCIFARIKTILILRPVNILSVCSLDGIIAVGHFFDGDCNGFRRFNGFVLCNFDRFIVVSSVYCGEAAVKSRLVCFGHDQVSS